MFLVHNHPYNILNALTLITACSVAALLFPVAAEDDSPIRQVFASLSPSPRRPGAGAFRRGIFLSVNIYINLKILKIENTLNIKQIYQISLSEQFGYMKEGTLLVIYLLPYII